jgi:hypothetical protein
MKEALPNLLKFVGALAVTAAIYFALSSNGKINDEVLNRSMEFLGTKLLAMVPEDQKRHVEREFNDFREQTRDGKISDEHWEGMAVAILNAEAEGKKFDREQIDSLFLTLKEAEVEKAKSEVERREAIIALSERVQEFEKFEKEYQKMIPLPPLADSTLPAPASHRSFYRVKPDFVIEVDTAAIAEIAIEHVKGIVAHAPRTVFVHPREIDQALRDLARELPRLKIEMRQMKYQFKLADSLARFRGDRGRDPYAYAWQEEWGVQWSDSMKKAMKELQQQQMRHTKVYMRMADSTRKAAEVFRRTIQVTPTPTPPGIPETPDPEKPKPPE